MRKVLKVLLIVVAVLAIAVAAAAMAGVLTVSGGVVAGGGASMTALGSIAYSVGAAFGLTGVTAIVGGALIVLAAVGILYDLLLAGGKHAASVARAAGRFVGAAVSGLITPLTSGLGRWALIAACALVGVYLLKDE